MKDRTIFSNTSEGMKSDFSDIIVKPLHFAIVNSIGGPEWPANLSKGTKRLQEEEIPYVYTPGSSQIDAVKDKADKRGDAVYEAIRGAHILSVDVDELRKLLRGVRGEELLVTEDTPVEKLLPLAKKYLGAQVIFATDGSHGANAIDKESAMWHIEAARTNGVKNTLGAGDAFNAAAALTYFETLYETGRGDVKKSLVYGSVNGAVAVESYGAHENCLTREELDRRVEEDSPRVWPIAA
jgi:sugar/nucleoside kinase (ribokinase family)